MVYLIKIGSIRGHLAARVVLALGLCFATAGQATVLTAAAPVELSRSAIEDRIRAIREWLTSSRTAQDGSRLLMGETRSEVQHKSGDLREIDATVPIRYQTTAACATLGFLAAHADHYGLDSTTAAAMDHMASNLRRVRASVSSELHSGAFAGESERRNYVTFGNAVCGRAFLDAHRVTGSLQWLTFAIGIGDYFVRIWQAGEQIAAEESERTGEPAPETGLFDRVTSAGRIQVTSSTWNLTAASFLHRLHAVAPRPAYASVAQSIAQFHLAGLRSGYDYFAPRVGTADPRLIGRWNLGYASPGARRHDFADGIWHRHGDIREPPTGTVGTDQIEYGLQALSDMDWPADEIQRIYASYRGLPMQAPCLDSGISFSGFFRLESNGGAFDGSGFGRYYDIVGAAVLAEVKRRLAPRDHQRAIAALVANKDDWAMLDCELQPIWTSSAKSNGGSHTARRSTLVAAASGVALLDALRHRPSSGDR